MKRKISFLIIILILSMLFVVNPSQSESSSFSPASRLIVTINAMTPYGEMGYYGPAIPLSDSPDENRLWLKVPRDVFFSGIMTILIKDALHEYVRFLPESGTVLENIADAGASFYYPSVAITYFDGVGNPADVCYFYISSQDRPVTEEQPTESVNVPVLYVDQDTGLEIAQRRTVTVQRGNKTEVSALPAPKDLLPDFQLTSESIVSISVDADGISNVQQVVFSYIYMPQESDKDTRQTISVSIPDIDDLGKWFITSYVDRFGDETSDKYITTLRDINGTFSNSATTNSELKVSILIDREGHDSKSRNCTRIAFILYEYKDHQVKSSYGRDYRIYVKDSDEKKISVDGSLKNDRIFIKESEVEELLNALYKEGEVKFVIEERDSVNTYSFTIDASKFPNAFIRLIMDESDRNRENLPEWAKEMLKLMK